jgi:formylglycine-generating enzyme required for sulfatase activity
VALAGAVYAVRQQGQTYSAGPVQLPTSAGTYAVRLTNPNGRSATQSLAVNNPTPKIGAVFLDPIPGFTAWTLTLQGVAFQAGLRATVAGTPCEGTCKVSVNAKNDEATLGPVYGNFNVGQRILITLTNPLPTLGQATWDFTVPYPVPVVEGYSLSVDTAGAQDVTLVLKGQSFAPGVTVTLPSGFQPNGVVPSVRNDAGTELVVSKLKLPANGGSHSVVLTNPLPNRGGPVTTKVWVLSDAGTSCVVSDPTHGVSECGKARETCCKSAGVPTGSFKRSYNGVDSRNASFAADLSAFNLDKYEVTVGRFRRFVEAWTSGWRPRAGAGKHRHLSSGSGLSLVSAGNETGWQSSWSSQLPSSASSWDQELQCSLTYATWTPVPGSNEKRPINCVDWYAAYAFCIWDGGFLPSDAEWNFAAAGGNKHLYFPWSSTDADTGIIPSMASYSTAADGCVGDGDPSCKLTDIREVGQYPSSTWGHFDLAGNLREWVLDGNASYPSTCINCTENPSLSSHVVRGGGFMDGPLRLSCAHRVTQSAFEGGFDDGFRCARIPMP